MVQPSEIAHLRPYQLLAAAKFADEHMRRGY